MTTRRTFLGTCAAAGAVALTTAAPTTAAPATAVPRGRDHPGRPRLTNLDHLRFLLDDVPLVPSGTHTTYRIEEEPTALAPWTYADADGATFRRIGGGALDPATGYYSQGAFNADDIARAAVVLLRDWRASGDERSRDGAHEVLRALAYLQNDSGPDAGRVVLWQQVDGSLNPSAEPVELPDPSDSAESYWLARTVWAFGEGYAAFRRADAEFARFLLERLHLCLDALEAESLSRYGQWVTSDGVDLPAWLVVGGADATAEAMLGLVAVAREMPRERRFTRALDRYAEGVAAMGGASGAAWPFGAVLPWTGALGFWHAWGGAAPEALASAGRTRRRRDWVRAAIADAGTFTPLVLASGGPHNAWTPVPGEAQIAYGAHGRVAGVLAAADAGGGPGLDVLAGLAAGWFFGANTAGVRVYDPATGVTFDGVETDGRVNRNSGAESTIHGLLAMMLLDDRPEVAELATSVTGLVAHDGVSAVDAESARLSAGCTIVRPATGAWTGEGNLTGGGYVHVPAGEWVEFDVDAPAGTWALPIVWRTREDAGSARWEIVGGRRLGETLNGGTGDAGLTEVEGSLVPQLLGRPLPAGPLTVRVTSDGDLRLDALLLRPAVATAHYATTSGDAVLYAGSTERATTTPALAAGRGWAYDADGDRRGRVSGDRVRVAAGGFTITR
ncbi:conserved hypothetical protein [Beutenbergia cavernae DSM 12333]|uniref:Uncharacterized protein n=1 Tax=Beutenbergia cavernae (strain ATCC BAA-8 / DSM 12333 / CCUG 43141 / JCM 11478 / NBRC 16432 / NCIMB 13614 / HKI 0122) TaxID=471853 RepID=C5BVD4_BEUC1|nr:hypothetical protein [Beutenbergia cavernae]ACQ80521.1 conserved hypothetical protein [Beutenbergia cavernae DSM 12333]